MKLAIVTLFATLAAASAQQARSVEGTPIHDKLEEFRKLQKNKVKKTPENVDMTAIKQHHARRVQKLEEMIEERRLAIEEHESGRRRLSDDEYSKKANQHKTFTRKLEQMKAKTDEQLAEQLGEMRDLFNRDRAADYVKLGKK